MAEKQNDAAILHERKTNAAVNLKLDGSISTTPMRGLFRKNTEPKTNDTSYEITAAGNRAYKGRGDKLAQSVKTAEWTRQLEEEEGLEFAPVKDINEYRLSEIDFTKGGWTPPEYQELREAENKRKQKELDKKRLLLESTRTGSKNSAPSFNARAMGTKEGGGSMNQGWVGGDLNRSSTGSITEIVTEHGNLQRTRTKPDDGKRKLPGFVQHILDEAEAFRKEKLRENVTIDKFLVRSNKVIEDLQYQERRAGRAMQYYPYPKFPSLYQARNMFVCTPDTRLERKRHFTQSDWFFGGIGVLIFFTAIQIGYDLDQQAELEAGRTSPLHGLTRVFNLVVCLIFAFECVAKAKLDEWRYFEDPWNFLDYTVVVCGLAEIVDEFIAPGSMGDKSIVGTLRLFRLLRIGKLLRLVRAFRMGGLIMEASVMVVNTVSSLFILIALFCAVYGMFTKELLIPDENDKYIPAPVAGVPGGIVRRPYIDVYNLQFRTTLNSIFTIFELSTLKGQTFLRDPYFYDIQHVRALMCLVYLLAAMAFMGVCIGAVTDKMINLYQDSIQEEAASVVLAEKFVLKLLEDTFEAADTDKNGTLDRGELMSALDSKTFTKYVELLGLTREDMILLFDAIDQDDLGMVNQRNFTDKILPLRGPVPSVNMYGLLQYVRSVSRRLERLTMRVSTLSHSLDVSLKEIEWFSGIYMSEINARQQLIWSQVEGTRMTESRARLQSKIERTRPRLRQPRPVGTPPGRFDTPESPGGSRSPKKPGQRPSAATPTIRGGSSLVEPNFPPEPSGSRPPSRSLIPSRPSQTGSAAGYRRRTKPVREGPPSGPL
jgi:hypothetical protein